MNKNSFRYIIFLLFATLCGESAVAQSSTINDMRNRAGSLQREIQEQERILLSSQEDVSSKLDNLNLIVAKIEEQKGLIAALEEEVRAIENEIETLTAAIVEQEAEVESSREKYAEALRRARKYSNFQSRLLFIFSADDFNTMVRRFRYAEEYMNAHLVLADSLNAQIARLEEQRRGLELTRQAKEESLALLESQRAELQLLEQEQRAIVAELQREAAEVRRLLERKRTELANLNRAIEREIERVMAEEEARRRREQAARSSSTSSTSASSSGGYNSDAGVAEMTGSFQRNKKRMPVPITGPYLLVEHYGTRNAVQGRGNVPINSGGITFEGGPGAKARCIFDGKVSTVYVSDNYSFVLVRHGSYISVYCNLVNIIVKGGDELKAGDIIGDVATEPGRSNPRMLFQLRRERNTLNPEEWLNL